MVTAMMASEDTQLFAIAEFLRSTGLQRALQTHDWASFARAYNGPNYSVNRYDIRLNAEYQKYSSGVLSDLHVRAVQLYLTYLGYPPGSIDGIAGEHTMAALAEWQSDAGVQQITVIDDFCVGQLCAALSKPPPVAA
jgi:peptidoglycan hydrolase-like protein with peptidoglycan-binding domain